jgi:hypothetical protein
VPITSPSLNPLDEYQIPERHITVGAALGWRSRWADLRAEYQREVDRSVNFFISERAALTAVLRPAEHLSLTGGTEYDLAEGWWGTSDLSLRYGDTHVNADFGVRRYRPFFELWTIWGAFSPVGFQEAGVTGAWRLAWRSARIEGQAAYRTYPDAGTSTTFGEYRTDGWRVGLSGTVGIAPLWTLEGTYHADVGLGAAKSSTSARVQRQLRDGAYVGFNATAFQTAYEFRVPEGVVWGLGADGAAPLGSRSRVSGSALWYHHRTDNNGSVPDWSQLRLTVRLDWTIGPEPGLSAVQGRQP